MSLQELATQDKNVRAVIIAQLDMKFLCKHNNFVLEFCQIMSHTFFRIYLEQ